MGNRQEIFLPSVGISFCDLSVVTLLLCATGGAGVQEWMSVFYLNFETYFVNSLAERAGSGYTD